MRTTNLRSIATIFEYYKKENPEAKNLKFWDTDIKFTDLEALQILLTNICKIEPNINIKIFNDFYIGYSIPQDIKNDIDEIKTVLYPYETRNLEIFNQQINEIEDKEKRRTIFATL